MAKHYLFFVCVFLCLGTIAVTLKESIAYQNLASENVLYLACDCNFPPTKWIENGNCVGMDVDIVKEVCKRIGIIVDIDNKPWERVIDEVRRGVIDGGFSAAATEEREQFAHFLTAHPVSTSEQVLCLKKSSKFSYKTVEDLHGKYVGKRRGDAFSSLSEFNKAVEDGKIFVEDATSTEQNLKKLFYDRIDAFIAYRLDAIYWGNKLALSDQMEMISITDRPLQLYLMVSKASKFLQKKPQLLEQMNQALKDMEKDGTFRRIYEKYTGKAGVIK